MGIVATMFARYPKIIDFSCGFQSYLSAGTCSKARLDRSISRSISDDKNSFNLISTPYRRDLPIIIPIGFTDLKRRNRLSSGQDSSNPSESHVHADTAI